MHLEKANVSNVFANVSGDLLPSFENKTTSQAVTENLSTLDSTRKKVIKNEALLELKPSLKHQICTSGHVIFNTRDTTFF